MLTRDQILGASDLPVEVVSVPEWGGDVGVRVMTGAERDRFEQSMAAAKGRTLDNVRAGLVAVVACDEAGNRLFEPQDVAALGGKSAAALDRVFTAALKLNRFSDADVADLAGN